MQEEGAKVTVYAFSQKGTDSFSSLTLAMRDIGPEPHVLQAISSREPAGR